MLHTFRYKITFKSGFKTLVVSTASPINFRIVYFNYEKCRSYSLELLSYIHGNIKYLNLYLLTMFIHFFFSDICVTLARMAIKNVCPIYDSWMLFVAAIGPMNCHQIAGVTWASIWTCCLRCLVISRVYLASLQEYRVNGFTLRHRNVFVTRKAKLKVSIPLIGFELINNTSITINCLRILVI